MAIRNDPDDYAWAVARNLRRTSNDHADRSRSLLKDRLAASVTIVAGFAGVLLMIGALLQAFG
jgi:hypothetical protein